MVVPILEVVLTTVGNHTIEDLNSQDGKEWFGAFVAAAKQIPGLVRAGWGQSYEDREIAMHFIGKVPHYIPRNTICGKHISKL